MSRDQAAGRPGWAAAASRGRLRIYLGSAPGAGTTCTASSACTARRETVQRARALGLLAVKASHLARGQAWST